jgi:hypothetical protein
VENSSSPSRILACHRCSDFTRSFVDPSQTDRPRPLDHDPCSDHLLILLHLSLTTPTPPHPPSLRRTALTLFRRITTLNSPRSLLAAIPPNINSNPYHDMQDLSRVEQLSRGIIRWKSWADGLLGSKAGQVGYRRSDDDEDEARETGWVPGTGKRKKGPEGKGKLGNYSRPAKAGRVEEDSWWEVTSVLVELWERDLRECWEWTPELARMESSDDSEEGRSQLAWTRIDSFMGVTDGSIPSSSIADPSLPQEPPLPMFLHQFPVENSSNPRSPRSDVSRLAKIVFSLYPVNPATPAPTKKNPAPVPFVEDEDAVDLSFSEEFGVGDEKDEAEEARMLERRAIAGRLMGMVSPNSTTIEIVSPAALERLTILPVLCQILHLLTPPPASHHPTTQPYLSPDRAVPFYLLPLLSLLPTACLPRFFSHLPRSTPAQPILHLLVAILPGWTSSSSSVPITSEVFIRDILPPGKTRATVPPRSAVVKLLMMNYIDWTGCTFPEGWREGFGLSEFLGEDRGQAWTWVEQMVEARVAGMS